MSFTEYRSTTGRPWGQDMGWSVLASSARSQSILFCSSGMFTLIAAWQAMEAAMRARNLIEQFMEHVLDGACFNPGRGNFYRDAARAEGFGFEAVVFEFVGDLGE